MKIRTVRFGDLTASELRCWDGYQTADRLFESPYFRPEFTRSIAAVRPNVEIAILEDGQGIAGFFPFERAACGTARAVGGRISDYHGVIAKRGADWSARELLRGCGLSAWHFDHVPAQQHPFADYAYTRDVSPFLDLTGGYDVYRQGLRKSGRDELKSTERKGRKLAREVGTLRFELYEERPELLDTLIQWKREQYRRTSVTDVFAFAWTREALRIIGHERQLAFAGVLSVLYAGQRPVAAHFGMRSGAVLHWWFPAYDPELSTYSPGRLLLCHLARASAAAGVRRIDLGRGMSAYKQRAMSGGVELMDGSVDLRPMAGMLRQKYRSTCDWVRRSPWRSAVRVPGRAIYRLGEWLAFRERTPL